MTEKSSKVNNASEKGAVVEIETDPDYRERETWSGKFDFLLACVGFSVGLGNVWRFPFLCYKNGGGYVPWTISLLWKAANNSILVVFMNFGAFLIPYFLCVIVGGIPLFFLEVSLGQFMGVAGINAWNICPFFRGIGFATTIIVFLLNCYYNVILAWAFRYFFASFTSHLPWAECDYDDWATEHCSDFTQKAVDNRCVYNTSTGNETGAVVNGTCISKLEADNLNITIYNASSQLAYYVDPVTDYWERKVLDISEGMHEMGLPKWDLILCLIFAWIVVYLCICKGIRSSGKVMYVTATSPYIFMLVLLIRNCLLDGAKEGVLFYLRPDLEKLGKAQVWVDAGTQIFFSYSIAIGASTALGSYNKFNHNCYRDCIIFALVNSGTSFFAGFIIFSILGHMSHIQGVDIKDVAEAGPGLAFIAYPKALTLLPAAPFWSIMFFLMIILLGLDSQFVGVEGVVTAVVDQFPGFLRRGYRREIFIAFVCFLSFLVGIPMVCPGGMYVFQLFDYYSGSRIILFVAFFMCIAVAWCYGVNRFYDNLEMMLGWSINPYMKIGWAAASPIFCITIFIMSAITYSELDYKRPKGTYHYPTWGVGLGWMLASFSAIWIPIVWIYHVVRYGQSWETFKLCFKPLGLKDHQLRPQDKGERTLANLNDPVSPSAVYAVYRRKAFGDKEPVQDGFDNPALDLSKSKTKI